MEPKELATKIVDKMFDNDPFSQWLGIERIKVEPGHCVLRMQIREEMLNGFETCHGGITFSLADSALAFAANSHGRISVALDVSISYPAAVRKGDTITATAEEFSITNRTSIYNITVTNQNDERVAFFKGTCYRTGKEWFSVNDLVI